MGLPNLDYSNPLHISTTASSTYTATKTCYAIGSGDAPSPLQITVNGTIIGGAYGSNGNNGVITLPLIKLNAGDTIVFPAIASPRGGFAVFDTL